VTFLKNKHTTNATSEDWDAMFESFPPLLQKEIIEVTQGQIVKGITFFKSLPSNFLIKVIAKLGLMRNYKDDIIYSEGDQADQMFFLFQGKVIMYRDITSEIEM
jgi:hypothetical protein